MWGEFKEERMLCQGETGEETGYLSQFIPVYLDFTRFSGMICETFAGVMRLKDE
jgi:hypothetical protein